MKHLTLLLIIVSGVFNYTFSQCTNATAYGSGAAPTTGGITAQLGTCTPLGGYATASGVISGEDYLTGISGGGCVTVTSGSAGGTVVAFGTSPLTWTAPSSGTFYFHFNKDCSACKGDNKCHTPTIECKTCPCTGAECSTSVDDNIGLVECDDIGTADFTAAVVNDTSTSSNLCNNDPSDYGATDPSCTGSSPYDTSGEWLHYTVDSGIGMISFGVNSIGSTCAGFSNAYAAIYQGSACNNTLSLKACGSILTYDWLNGYGGGSVVAEGIDPSKDVWVYLYGDDCWVDLGFDITGMAAANNTDCSSPEANWTTGCNVGAPPTNWGSTNSSVGPESTWGGGTSTTCVGTSNWASNDNTVYYEVTATETVASITINDVECNTGTDGDAQFAVFDDCSCFMTAGYVAEDCFKGCSAGTGSVTLDLTLVKGENYTIVVDGYGGDWCKWSFALVGIEPLSSNTLSFNLKQNEKDALLDWSTETNVDISHFIISRTGIDGEKLIEVNSTGALKYKYVDENLSTGTYLYKIIQVNTNGSEIVSEIKSTNIKQEEPVVRMNSSSNTIEINTVSNRNMNYVVEVFNNIGQRIISKSISGSQNQIDINSFDGGLYHVVIRNTDFDEAYSYKIVK